MTRTPPRVPTSPLRLERDPPTPSRRRRIPRRFVLVPPASRSRRAGLFSVGDLCVAGAIPFALLLLGILGSVLGAFDLYTRHVGLSMPAASSAELVTTVSETSGRGGGEPLSMDTRVYEQIRRTQYTVQPGDTVSGIADEFGLDPGTILDMNANAIDDVRRLLPGTKLLIPDRDGLFHAVQPGESLSSISDSYDISLAAIVDANGLESSVLSVGDTLFIPGAEMEQDQYLLAIGELFQWPLRSFRFTSGYGMRTDPITGEWRMHTGIDLANVVGTPVLAARSGRVVHVEPNAATLGDLIILDHGDGFRSLYGHLSVIGVRNGQWVSTGEMIGRVGNTGRSTGPHLHFSVIRGRNYEDPEKHMP